MTVRSASLVFHCPHSWIYVARVWWDSLPLSPVTRGKKIKVHTRLRSHINGPHKWSEPIQDNIRKEIQYLPRFHTCFLRYSVKLEDRVVKLGVLKTMESAHSLQLIFPHFTPYKNSHLHYSYAADVILSFPWLCDSLPLRRELEALPCRGEPAVEDI